MSRGAEPNVMKNTGTLAVSLPSDCEIALRRVFRAPRQLVYDAFSKPEILKLWFGPRGWSLVTCDVDAQVGGGFRFVVRGPDGRELGMRGVYRELSPPERSIHSESFDDFPGESLVTTVLTERDGETTLVATILYASKEVRDAVIKSGMEGGAAVETSCSPGFFTSRKGAVAYSYKRLGKWCARAASIWRRAWELAVDSPAENADWVLGELLFCAVALNLNQLSKEGSNPCATIPWLAFQTG
jgi:uncharacterized protein YndB with AHSA1/START domain